MVVDGMRLRDHAPGAQLAGKVVFGHLERFSLHVDAEGIMEWLSGAEEETGGPWVL